MKKFLFISVCAIILTACHVGRFFWYNFADYKDHKKFPKREISAPESTFYFERAPEQIRPREFPNDVESFEQHLINNKSLGLTIIRNDSILYEWYDKGFDTSSVMTTFSMAKSFVSLLVGIAIEEGKIKSADEPITTYIPELKDPAFSKISIEHLLNMQSGIHFNESYYNPFGTIAKFYYGKHLLKYVKRLKVDKDPGQGFDYKSLDTQLLGIIIERSTGQKLAHYFQEKLWQPLDMQYDASWSIDSKTGDTEKAFCCLNARILDFAKIGKMMLQKGKWGNEQIVPEEWVELCFKSKNYPSYSYQWWILNTPQNEIMAQGILGQYLYINPAKNIVIVRMGKKWGKSINWWNFFTRLSQPL